MLHIDQAPKSITKFAASPVQAASYGADGYIEDGGDLLVTAAVKVFQDHDSPVFRAELAQCSLNDLFAFGPFKGIGWVSVGGFVCGICTPIRAMVTNPAERGSRTATPMPAERQIHGNPVDPSIKRAISLELVELLVRAQERVLQNVPGVFRGAAHVH
jgi:hypothetical protein